MFTDDRTPVGCMVILVVALCFGICASTAFGLTTEQDIGVFFGTFGLCFGICVLIEWLKPVKPTE